MRRVNRQLCIFLLVIAVPASAFAGKCAEHAILRRQEALFQQGWKVVEEQQRTRIYNRQVGSSSIYEVLANALVDAPPWRVFAVISDYDRFADFMPYVTQSKTLRTEGLDRWVQQRLSFPFLPISDRHYVIKLHAQVISGDNRFYCVDWTLAEHQESESSDLGVIPVINDGFWLLRSVGGGAQTDVAYFVHTDPGGWISAWIANRANEKALPEVIQALRDRVKNKDYDRFKPKPGS
jgi:Polyketide cyclase / dehydrase and lipid transport